MSDRALFITPPRLRIARHGTRLRIRQRGNWSADNAAALREASRVSVAVDKTLAEAIVRARTLGVSWRELGKMLGASDEADTKRTLISVIVLGRRQLLEEMLDGL